MHTCIPLHGLSRVQRMDGTGTGMSTRKVRDGVTGLRVELPRMVGASTPVRGSPWAPLIMQLRRPWPPHLSDGLLGMPACDAEVHVWACVGFHTNPMDCL